MRSALFVSINISLVPTLLMYVPQQYQPTGGAGAAGPQYILDQFGNPILGPDGNPLVVP